MKKIYLNLFAITCMMFLVSGVVNAQTELVTDGSFEAGAGGGAWTESSTNFGTPLCDLAGCGNGTGTGARTGNWWAWFGGYPSGVETASVEQSFVIPMGGTVTLTFWLEQIVCDDPMDFLDVQIDGNSVFMTDGASTLCGVLGYSLQTVDISAYADGNSHTLTFTSTTFATNGGGTNFFVDDVSVISNTGGGGPACTDTTTYTGLSVVIPDDDPAGVTDAQTVSGVSGTNLGGDVKLAAVCFKITHTWVGDLIATLTGPNGASVVLMDRPGVPATLAGCDGDDIDVCVQIGTGNEMENVCNNLPAISGNYTAANGADLNQINVGGGSPNGNWELNVSDNIAQDTGTLIEWKLIFDNGPVAAWTPPGELCESDPAINLDALINGTMGGTWSGNGVTGNMFDPSGLSGPVAITYMVTDTATGCTDSQTSDIIVIPGVATASFTASPVSLTVNFTNTSTGGGTYLWDFGDTNTSTDQNPSHTYANGGTYTVLLSVTNACGTDTVSQTVIVQNCPDIILDGGFEAGPGGGSWTEASSNFGTPICDLASCGNGTGTGPNSGGFWTWFGGIAAFEEGSVSQTITIAPNSTADLNFWLEQIICDGPDDFMKIAVDADTVYATDGNSPLCGNLGYTLQTVNLDAYADGLPHTLTFFSRIYGINGNGSNFFVDDISLIVCTSSGIVESNLNEHVVISPVPANDYFEIKFTDMVTKDVVVEVSDMVGKTIYTNRIQHVYDNQTEKINVSKWSKGIYSVKISASGNSIIRKIVVQ